MLNTSLCMICLRTDKILRTVDQGLFNFHDELCDYSLPTDRQAQYCFECEWKLRKFRRFKQICIKADKILRLLQQTGASNKSIFQKQLIPPSLERWDGRNSKTYFYIYVEGKNAENKTETSESVLNTNSSINTCDYKIRVKQFPTEKTFNAPVQKPPKLLNSILGSNTNTGSIILAPSISGNKRLLFTKCKQIDKEKDTNDVLCVDNIDPLGGEHNANNADSVVDDSTDNHDSIGDNDNKDDVPIFLYNVVSESKDPLANDLDNKDNIPLLSGKDVTGHADPVSDNRSNLNGCRTKTIDKRLTDFDNAIATYAVKNCSADVIDKTVTEPSNRATIHGVIPEYDIDKIVPDVGSEISVYSEPSNQRQCTDVLKYDITQNNKENETLVVRVKQYPGAKQAPRMHSVNAMTSLKKQQCYPVDKSNKVVNLNSLYQKKPNTIILKGTTPNHDKSDVKTNNLDVPNLNVKHDEPNQALAYLKSNLGKTYRCIQKLNANEIELLYKLNPKVKPIPIKKVSHNVKSKGNLFSKKLKKSYVHVKDGLYYHIENGKIVCTKKGDSKVKEKLIKKKIKQEKPKKIVKKNAYAKLTKERKEYLELLSFVKLDKHRTKQKEASEKKDAPESVENATGEGDQLIEKSVDAVKNANGDEYDLLPYSHDDPFLNLDFLELKTDAHVSNNQEKEVTNTSRKTLTELTNINISLEDQEVKVVYVLNPDKDIIPTTKNGSVSENEFNNDLNNTIVSYKEKNVEFPPEAVATKEINEYCKDTKADENKPESNTIIDTFNPKTNNAPDEERQDTEKEPIETQKEVETEKDKSDKKDNEVEKLSSKFNGLLKEKKVYMKLRKLFKINGEIKTAEGNVISKEALVHFYGLMDIEDKWQVARAVAARSKIFSPESVQILWKLQQKYESEFSSVFDIVYLNTQEKVLREFLQRRTYSVYLKAKFKCELCLKPFDNQSSLEYHNKWHDPSYGEFECSLCHTRYKSKVTLYTHMQMHAVVYKCKLCPLIAHRKEVMISHYLNHKGRRTICKICGQSYSNGSSYKQHKLLHSTGHECNMCARNFVSATGLATHVRCKHPDVDVEQSPGRTRCDVCDVIYVSREVYLKHYRNVHDPSTTKPRTVRTLGAQWRIRKPVDDTNPKPRKRQRIRKIPPPDKPMLYPKLQGLYASQTFAAATRAIQMARCNNVLRDTTECNDKTEDTAAELETYNAIKHIEGNDNVDEEEMTLVYEEDSHDAVNNVNEEIVYTFEDLGAGANEEIVESYEDAEAVNSIAQEVEHPYDDANAQEDREIAPSYEEVTRAVARRKTIREAYEEITSENFADIERNVTMDMPQHFDAITNASRRTVGLDARNFYNTTDAEPSMQSLESRSQHNYMDDAANRPITRLWHTVDATTQEKKISKRVPTFNLRFDTSPQDAIATTDFVTRDYKTSNVRNVKRGRKREQVFDTMSRDNKKSILKKGGKRMPKESEFGDEEDAKTDMEQEIRDDGRIIKGGRRKPQMYGTLTDVRDRTHVPQEKCDTYKSRYIKGGKRKHDMPQVYGTMTEIDSDRTETRSNTMTGRNNNGGKRKPDMPLIYDTLTDIDAENRKNVKRKHDTQVYGTMSGIERESSIQYETSYGDAPSSNIGKRRDIYSRTDMPQLDSKHVGQEILQNYEIGYDSEIPSSRTIEAMTMHAANSQSGIPDFSQPGPDMKRKKVNVEMNPTYGYVYSTYHP